MNLLPAKHQFKSNQIIGANPGLSTLVKENKIQFEIKLLDWPEESQLLPADKEERILMHEIYVFTKGYGIVRIDENMYQVRDKNVFCFVPGQVRRFSLEGDNTGYLIRFSPEFVFTSSHNHRLASWLDEYGTSTRVPAIQLDSEMQEEVLQIIHAMLKEFMNYFLLRAEILSGLLHILLIYLSRKLQLESHQYIVPKDKEMVHQFKLLVKTHFLSKKLVTDYASELCVTPNYLNKTVKKITGFTASYHIQQQIILEAKRKAIYTNSTMKEIAYSLGFDSIAHFSKFFKNNSGMNFTTFKRGLSVPF